MRFVTQTRSRDRALSVDEIRLYLNTMYDSNIRRQFKLGLHLILLTLVRKNELFSARWEHVDLEAGEWTIPAEQSKTGKPHIVYLARHSAELFRELKQLAGTIHDLRRTGATHLHEHGFLSDVVEKALNHTIGGVRGVYNRAQYKDQHKEMLQHWANYIEGLLG